MKRTILLIIAGYLLIYIIPLNVRPLMIPDETRYGEIPREMIASGDWIVPRLNGVRYFEKPVMGYWMNALSILAFGENNFAIRFPSALAAGLTALFIFWLARRDGGGAGIGVGAAAIFLTCVEVFGVGVFSVLDSMLAFFVTGAMAFLYAAMTETGRQRIVFYIFCGIFCGLAFLTKGFLALAVPVAVSVPFALWEKRFGALLRWSAVIIIAAVAVSLPWCLAIHFRESQFWNYFFWQEHIHRFMADNAQHREAFWFFLPILAVGAMPWTPLMPAVAAGLKQVKRTDPFFRFALCWFVFAFLFFSSSKGKLATYVLPCYPPLALLISMGLHRYMESDSRRLISAGMGLLAIVMGVAGFGLAWVQLTGIPVAGPYGADETWKWTAAVLSLLIWGGLALLSIRVKSVWSKLLLFAAAPLMFMLTAHVALPRKVMHRKSPGILLERHAASIRPDTRLVAFGNCAQAVCWFYKRSDVYVLIFPDELEYGLSYPEDRRRFLDADAFRKMVGEASGQTDIVLFAKARQYQEVRATLSEPKSVDELDGFILVRYETGPKGQALRN